MINYFIVKCKTQQQEFSREEIINFSQVSMKTIERWRGNIGLPKRKPGKKSKIDEKAKKAVLDYVKEKITTTQTNISNHIKQRLGIMISQPSISRFLKKENITCKKVSYRYSEQQPRMDEIRKFIKNFEYLYLSSPVLALDECSFHLNEAPRRGYSLKGFRAVSYRPGYKGSNITLILCIQNVEKQGVFSYELIEGGLNTRNFHNFLSRLKLPEEKDYYLLMDNLPVHHAKQSCIDKKLLPIKELLKSKRAIPIYLPAYTPQLNPVELCFNFLRRYIEKHQPRTIEELRYFIAEAIRELNKQDLRKYFKHCLDFYLKDK